LQSSTAIFKCKGTQANSTIYAVNPNTTRILDSIAMPDTSTTPHTITMHNGKISIYISGNKAMYRYLWNPETKKLSQDTSWVVSQ
jgi:hypothetical protein